MTLREAIEQYISWSKALGSAFRTQADVLHQFLKSVGEEVRCDSVAVEQIRAFLAGKGPLTQTRALKYSVLSGFYRYAISRGHILSSPLPHNEPKKPAPPPPYIYSRDDIRRLFDAIDISRKRALQFDADTFRTFLSLLYGAGLRAGETRCLTLNDVDLSGALLTVRDTKFYKSRLVPIGPQLVNVLNNYAKARATRHLANNKDLPFLVNRDGSRLAKGTVELAFQRLRRCAGIQNSCDGRQSPTLHSFRHSFAVHRLTAWYREGADVQRLLPVLSTYLGHARLVETQVYLSMTPELLQQASSRFELYARGMEDE